jgi:putative ABC transport system substrate-binding protein
VPDLKSAALGLGFQLIVLNASSDSEIDSAFAAAVEQRASALIIGADSFFLSRRDQIVALAARYALPTIFRYREEAAIGGL